MTVRIGTEGLYFATYRAVFPVCVTQMMRGELKSWAALTAADVIVSVRLMGFLVKIIIEWRMDW